MIQYRVRSVWDAGLHLFRETLLKDEAAKVKITESMLLLVENERDGSLIDTNLAKSLVQMMVDTDIYKGVFEAPFLEATKRYYKAESQRRMHEMTVPQYLRHVSNRLEQEVDCIHCQGLHFPNLIIASHDRQLEYINM